MYTIDKLFLYKIYKQDTCFYALNNGYYVYHKMKFIFQ